MLGDKNLSAVVAVKDLEAAKKFYSETLGLNLVHEMAGVIAMYKSGDSWLQVYTSQFAGTNQATAASWFSDDVEGDVAALVAKGIAFEHYGDLPGVTLQGDVHVDDSGMKVAWFKDPDGNVLCVSTKPVA